MEELPVFSDEKPRKITSPIQFFGGDSDELIDSLKTVKRIKEIFPNFEIHVSKDTGHVIIDQFPAIREFIISS